MTFSELKTLFAKYEVPKTYYSFEDDFWADRFHLVKKDLWEFYYLDERGGKEGYRQFDKESEACMFFFEFVIRRRSEWAAYR